MDKQQRQHAIRQLVAGDSVASQQELVRRLRADGIRCTQASVSRDLRELGLVKADGRYTAPDTVAVLDPPRPEVAAFIESADPIGANLVVLRTTIGAAQQVGLSIDRLDHPDIAGTIAGDDTIFIAVASRTAQGRVLALLRPRPRP